MKVKELTPILNNLPDEFREGEVVLLVRDKAYKIEKTKIRDGDFVLVTSEIERVY